MACSTYTFDTMRAHSFNLIFKAKILLYSVCLYSLQSVVKQRKNVHNYFRHSMGSSLRCHLHTREIQLQEIGLEVYGKCKHIKKMKFNANSARNEL